MQQNPLSKTSLKSNETLMKTKSHFPEGAEISPQQKDMDYSTLLTTKEDIQEPKSYNEAVNSPQAKNWRKAMQAEYDSLKYNNTWTLVNEPEDQQVLPGKWVYKVTYGADGQVNKLKARYVAKGYAQVEGLDFFLHNTLQLINQKRFEFY